jgi:hypothetical protein
MHCISCSKTYKQNKQTNSVAISQQANYTDRATTAASKLLPTFVGGGVTWSGKRIPTANLGFLDRSRYFSFKYLLIYPHEAKWTPFQTHHFSEILAAQGLEPGASKSVTGNSDH